VGLLQGTMTIRFYRVDGELPKKYRDEFLEQIKRFSFRELAPEKEFGAGWVSPANLLDVDFDDSKVFQNQYLTLALRADKKQVNARLFRALLQKELEKFKKQTNQEKVKPSQKKEIKDRLQKKMMESAEPARRTWDVCWDAQAGRLYFFAVSDRTQDLFRETFQKTFHMEPTMVSVKGRFEAVTGESLPPDVDDPGREFLTWLFWRTDSAGGKFELPKSGDVHLWVEDRMLFKDGAERPATATLAGGDPARSPEARAALFGGKKLSRVKLGLKRGEREWSFTLDGETLDMGALKIPALLTQEEDEVLFERLALLEEAAFVVDELFGEYAKARLSDGWERGDAAKIARWIAEGAPSAIGGGARKVAAAAGQPRRSIARSAKARR
jgi:hypothetical protein